MKGISMAADIHLDIPANNWVTVEADVLKMTGADFILDSTSRRGTAHGGHRRALVHADGDRLEVNFNGDFTGGVTINNARVNLACLSQQGRKLPKNGRLGDLLVTRNRHLLDGQPVGVTVTLWLCIGFPERVLGEPQAQWVPLSHGDAVEGTL